MRRWRLCEHLRPYPSQSRRRNCRAWSSKKHSRNFSDGIKAQNSYPVSELSRLHYQWEDKANRQHGYSTRTSVSDWRMQFWSHHPLETQFRARGVEVVIYHKASYKCSSFHSSVTRWEFHGISVSWWNSEDFQNSWKEATRKYDNFSHKLNLKLREDFIIESRPFPQLSNIYKVKGQLRQTSWLYRLDLPWPLPNYMHRHQL